MGDQEFRTQLGTMYQAARVEFPKYAGMVADCAETLSMCLSTYQDQLAPTLQTQPLADAVAMNTECYDLLRRAVIFLDNGAQGLEDAANDFAKTDQGAADSSKDIQGLLSKPFTRTPVPPALPKADK